MPWQVPITVDGLEYPVTFNTENEPTQQDYDEAIQQILQQQQPTSELPAEPTATPEKELPFFDLSDIGSSLGQAVTSLGRTIPASFGQLYEGTMNPWEKGPESLQRQKEMRDVQREAEQAQAEAEASGDASIIGRSIRSAQPSLGFSLTTLPASLGAGAVTGLGTAYLSGNPIIAQRAGMAAGGAAGGYAAYRMAGSQFLDDARERIDNFFLEKEGRLPNKQEQDEAYQELLPLAQEMGMAEALPEAFGNLALAGAGKYIYRILGGKTGVQQLASGALSKVKGMNALKAVGAGAAGAGTEVGTEAVTDVLQESPYKKLEEGIMQGQPVEAVEIPPFTLERFKQGVERVAEPTLATTAMMGLVGGAGGMAYRGLTRQSFEESEFRDKMTKQAESAEKQLSSPDITPAQRKFLADKVEESNAALKALDEGRSSDVEKYFNVRFTKAEEPSMPSPDEVAVQLNTDAAKSLEAAGSSESAKAQAGFDATLKEILPKTSQPTVQPEQAAEAARIAEEQRKVAANAAPKANVPPPPSPVIKPESTVEELQAELTSRENARRTLDFGDQGNAQIDNDIQTLTREIQSRSAKPPVVTAPPAAEATTLPPAEAPPTTPAVTPTDFNTRNKDMLPDEDNFGGKFTKPLQIDPASYSRDGEIETVNYINPETGNVDVFVSAFGNNDFIAYMRQYDENGNPTNTFTSKLERRTEKAGATKKMLQSLQSRLPEGHTYTEDVSVSTDGLRFFLNQLNQGYEPVIENGRPATTSVAISGESIRNDLPIPVDPTGKFENIRITNPKDFAKVKTYLGKMLEGFGVGLNESNVRWENGTAFIDLPVLRKVTPSPQTGQATAPAVEEPTLTPEPELYAPAQVPSEESVYEEPQDRIESREAEEAILGDSLLRPAEGEVKEEVMPSPEVAADPFAAAPLVDNLPALIAVRDNNATPEQVQSLVDQGLVEQVDGQNIITEAGVAAMPEDQRPKLTPAERAAEVEGMAAPVFTRNEIIVSKPSVSRRSKPNGVDGESITEIKAPSKVSSPDNWNRLGDIEKLDATVEARLDFATGKVPKKADKSWTAFAGRKTKTGRSVLARNVTYNEAIEAAKDFVESANFQPQPTAAEKPTPDSVAVEPGATRGVQAEPVGGSIPMVGEVSPETEISSRENLGPKAAAAKKKQAAADEAAKKRQEKQDNATKSSLNSVVGPQKEDAIQGTVTKVDVETAREALTNSGEIPNAYLTNVYESLEAFLADKANARLFPSAYARLQTEKNIEGLYENGQTLIFAKQIQVSNLDRNLATMLGLTPEQAAARRVIAHENGHKAISLFTMAEKRELRGYLMRAYSDEQIAKLVETYDEYADWRTNLESRFEALEELLMRDFEKMEKIPTGGVWDDIVQFLKRVWRRLTGQKGEPTLKNLKDVARLMRNAMKRPAVPLGSFTLKDGGKVKLSAIAPTAGITPEMDAEYLAAVEAGDSGNDNLNQLLRDASPDERQAVVDSWIERNPKAAARMQQMVDEAAFDQTGLSSEDVLRLIDQNSPSMALDYRAIAKALGGKKYVLAKVPVSTLRFEEGSESVVDAKRAIPSKGPIIIGVDGVIVDGRHRAMLSKQNKQEAIIAYVPQNTDPVTRDESGNVIPPSQRFQPTSPDIRFSRPQFASDTDAATSAGNEAARSTIYSERDMDVREAIRRAYEAMPKDTSVAVPIGELFAKTEELMPGVTQDEFSNVLQDLFEDNGAVLQEGEQIIPEQEVEIQAFEKDNPFNELIRKSTEKSPSLGEINGVSKKFVQRVLRPASNFATNNGIRIDDNAPLQVRAMPDGSIIIGYSLSQERFDELQKMAPQAASQYTKDSVIKELIHLSDLIGLRNQWIKSGKKISFDQFVLGEQSNLAFSLIQKADSLNDLEAESLRRILASSLSLYNNNPEIANLSLNELLDLAAQYPYVLPELVRSLIQLKKTGQLTETAFRKIANVLREWQEIVLQWISDGYASAKEGVFGEMLSERIKNAENNLAQFSDTSEINVTTPEGRRAGFVVVMPRAAKASKIPIEDAEEASKSFKVDLAEAGKGRVDKTAKFKGKLLKDTEIPEHNVKSYVLYRDTAIKLIDDLMAKTNDILVVAEALQDPEFQIAVGLQVSKDVSSDMITIARSQIGIEIENRLANEIRKERNPRRKRELELAEKRGIIYYNAGTGAGQALQNRQESLTDPRYRGRNLFNQAKLQKEQKSKDKLDAITGGTEKITDIITKAEEKAAEETTQAEVEAQESAVEDDQDAIDLAAGEATLTEPEKSLYEEYKDILRRRGILDILDKRDASAAKASISSEERNALAKLTKAERDEMRKKDDKRRMEILAKLLGKEEDAKTPEQKKTRKKREKMVNTAKKRAEAGKSLETPQEGETESSEEQVSKAERTAQAILKDLSERYSDPLIIKEKKPNVDAMRELYKERVKQGVGPNQMTEKSFVNKAVELGADEKTAGILWKAAELEIDAREAMRQDKILQRKAVVGERADAQAHRIIFAKERLKRQSGFAGIDTNPNKDTIIQAFRDQVKSPVILEDFVARLKSLNVSETVAKRLFTAAEREKADLEAMEAFRMLEGPKALGNLLREMNKARPADSVPLERAMPWRKILSSNPKDVAEYRQRIFEAISDLPSFQNLTDEQKERLADLYAEAWENRRQAILDRMLRDEIKKARDRDEISEDVEKKLQQSRNKILEIVNLGGFNNDDLVKILGERYGISTSFTEEQKERIQKLADQLQDEDMNTAKRNKLAMEFAVELAGAMDVPVSEIISNWWTSSVLFGPQTIFSIGAAFLNGGYSIATIGTRRMLAKLFKGDIQGAIEESILMLKGFARYLGAFKQSGRRAWNYLWTGDVGLLGTGSTDILNEINNFDQLQRFQRHKLLAEQLAKDPRMVRRYVGVYLRFVSRLLTALDAFNVMVTKAGTASLALRMSGMSTDKIIEAEKMLNLKAYKDQVIRDYFDNKAPKTQAEKALVDSYAEAEMYRAINKLGGKMENADYLASESAMTMQPTGFGGVVYDAITGFFAQRQSNADEYLEKMKKDWISNKDLKAVTFLALAYLRQFAAYNAAGLTGSKFVRYASNKFNQGLSFIPFAGLLRQLEAKDDKIKGKDAFRETIYRNQIVSFVMLMVGYAVVKAIQDEPDDEERGNFWNGGWSNLTPDQKKQMLAKGQKEYTMGFKFNGRWYVFNYQNWPLNQILSAIGSMSDQIRFSPEKWDEKSALSKGVAGMVSGVKSTLEIPALSGLQELVGNRLASKDPTEKELDRLSRVASGWVGGFVPRILKDIDFYTQPELRKYEGLWEKTASHIPIYRRYIGEEYYDILGKQIKRNVIPGSREFMMGPTEPEYKILGALNARNIWLTPANAEYRMIGKGRNRRRLTQEEADAYSLETGRGYRDMLLRYGQRALQMPTERARAFLQDKADEVRDRALKRVYRR